MKLIDTLIFGIKLEVYFQTSKHLNNIKIAIVIKLLLNLLNFDKYLLILIKLKF